MQRSSALAAARRPLDRLARPILNVALALGLAFPWAPAAAQSSTASTQIQQQRDILLGLSRELDRAAFEVNALAFELAFEDAETITEHVRSTVRTEVYAGILRGAQGTLVSGAGNALDKSILLAGLLLDAGYEVRIATGALQEAAAMTLVLDMFEERTAAGTQTASAADLERVSQVTGASIAELEATTAAWNSLSPTETEHHRDAESAQGTILAALAAAGLELGADLTAELLAEASDYAWVEYRLGASDEWAAAHPAWPPGSEPPTVTAEHHFDGEMPAELTHQLRIENVVERKRGDEFTTDALMTPWQRPVANMFGITLTVGNTVLGEGADASLTELGTSLADVAFFAPLVNGALAPGAQAFDTMGNLVPPDVAASAMAGVFQTNAENLNQAIGVLGALGSDEPGDAEPFALTAQWIDFVLIAPGGEETRHRRMVFDRRTPEARVQGSTELLDQSVLLEGILTSQSVTVVGGALSDAYLASRFAEQSLDQLDALERAMQLDLATATPDDMVAAYEGVSGGDHLALLSAFDLVGATTGAVAYRAEPTIVSLHSSLTPGPEPRFDTGVDVIHNARRFLALDGGRVRSDAERAVLAGAWETAVERAYMQRFSPNVQGAYAAFAGSGGAVVVSPDLLNELPSAVPPAAAPAMQRDLEAGYAVVLPAGDLAPGVGPGWWRVDLATGETLGMGASGRGTAVVEYKIGLEISAIFAGALAVPGAAMCLATTSNEALALCLCDLIVTTGVAFGLGALIGLAAASGGAAVAAFLVMDVGVGTVTAIPGLLPGPCSTIAARVSPWPQDETAACVAA